MASDEEALLNLLIALDRIPDEVYVPESTWGRVTIDYDDRDEEECLDCCLCDTCDCGVIEDC